MARSNAKAQNAAEAVDRAAVSSSIEQAMRMAFAMEAHADPVQAAAFAGLTTDPVQAKALAKAARAIYPDGVNNAALGGLGRAALGPMLLQLLNSVPHLKPDYIAGGMRALVQMMTILLGNDSTAGDGAGTYVFNLTSASGAEIPVIRDPANVVRPKTAP